jgi:hypothetical protein
LSLRRPGRERGRLPSTLGSSFPSAATDGKLAVAAASRAATARNLCAGPPSWVNVAPPTGIHGQWLLGGGEWGLAALSSLFREFRRMMITASGYTAPAPWGASAESHSSLTPSGTTN